MTLDLWDLLLLLTISPVAAYIIGAVVHIAIDQEHGKRLVDRYFRTTKAEIVDPMRVELLAKPQRVEDAAKVAQIAPDELVEAFAARVPAFDLTLVGRAFDGWARSPAGIDWAAALAETAAESIEQKIVQRTSSAAGAVARKGQAKIADILNHIDLGNPLLNGIWAWVPPETKAKIASQIARALRRGGLDLIAEGEVVSEDAAAPETPQLEAGGELPEWR